MKRKCLTIALLSLATGVMAQSVEDGQKNLYYGKYQSAKQALEKAVAAKASDDRGYYYLGLAELGLENKDAAAAAFTKGLQAVPNSPLLTAGAGRIDLINGDAAAAKTKFEAAATATKGKNGEVARAIADANTEVKAGNRAYALSTMQTLLNNEGAKKKDQYTATAADYIELGDALRMLGGENGGKAIEAYEKALEIDPKNAEAIMKQGSVNYNAKLKQDALANWIKATTVDPNYGPAFFELYSFYFTQRADQFDIPKAKEYLQKYLAVADPTDKVGNEYYLAAITFFNKDYDAAIEKAKSLIPIANEAFQGKLTRLIGDAYLQKGDSLTARKTMDEYVAKVGDAKLEVNDYKLLSEIYGRLKLSDSTAQAQNDTKALGYLEKYATADTTKDAERFENVAKAYAAARIYGKAGDWYQKLLDLKIEQKQTPTAVDYYNVGLNYYRGSASENGTDTVFLNKADTAFGKLSEKFPDITTGPYWRGMANAGKDVEAKTGVALPYFEKYISMAEADSEKNKTGLVKAYTYIMVYYYNKDDKANLQKYLDKVLPLDPNNEAAKQIKENMAKPAATSKSK